MDAAIHKVSNTLEFNQAVKMVKPGETILLANGTWTDVELKINAIGKEDSLIYVKAEEKGKVFLEGESNVKIGGAYIHLEGLVFRNGHTASSSVISFQSKNGSPCNYCRVTECVIDDYNPSERFDTDYWVELFGRHNRFDHNYIVAKRNRGVTIAVRLKNEEDRENFHRIDHNYFGYHATLGSNGGETLRIGTSHYSMSNSNTIVEDNYFEHCNGELEIISSKSCQNVFRNNTFHECTGTLTMRHGNETVVENNYFFGNRIPNTGGIRVINETQTVRNNYLNGLTGYRFRGALVVMNGVPNSPLNRYFQVKDSDISNNVLMDCDHIQLCAGSDEERSATPINTTFSKNLIYNTHRDELFTIYDDVSGISFSGNTLSPNVAKPTYKGKALEGFEKKELSIVEKGNMFVATAMDNIGPDDSSPMPSADNTGVTWYPRKNYKIRFGRGNKIMVAPGENTIIEAVKNSSPGDVLVLSSGDYHLTRSIELAHTLTIASTDVDKPVLTFERSPMVALNNGGSLKLSGLVISGKESADYSGNAVVRTSRYSMIDNYKFIVEHTDFEDLDVNHSFNVLKVYKNTFADSVAFVGCSFNNISGHILNMDKEFDDIGIYNAENVLIDDCQFKDIGGSVVKLYRGGRDESTFGPMIDLKNSTLSNVGHAKRNKNKSAIDLHGVQLANISNLKIENSKKIKLHLIVGEPIINLADIELIDSETIESNSTAITKKNVSENGKK